MPNILAYLAEADAAALQLKSAEAGTELYRRRLEEARAQLDGARGRESAAKATLDGLFTRVSEECGVQRRTVKDTVEERVAGLIASGLYEVTPLTESAPTTAAAEAPARPKVTRVRTPKPAADAGPADASGAADSGSDAAAATKQDLQDGTDAGIASSPQAGSGNGADETGAGMLATTPAATSTEPEAPAPTHQGDAGAVAEEGADAVREPDAATPASPVAAGVTAGAAPETVQMPVPPPRPNFLRSRPTVPVPGLGG